MTHPGPKNFVLIVGAMKSGTSSLFRVLSQHPEVAVSRQKEPEFFSDETIYKKGFQWYQDLWDWDPARHTIALEASTSYTKAPQRTGVPQRIADVSGSQFRFIYIMRHPFERIESHVRHGMYAGWTRSLDEGLRSQDELIDITRYASQIEEYLQFFPRESLLLLTLDEFKQDPEDVMKRVCRHIGIADDFKFQNLKIRENAGERYDVPKFVNRIGDSTSLSVRILKKILNTFSKSKDHYELWRYSPIKVKRGRYQLTDIERHRILDLLRPELQRLRKEYGIDTKKYWQM
jgi:hypothetical protein